VHGRRTGDFSGAVHGVTPMQNYIIFYIVQISGQASGQLLDGEPGLEPGIHSVKGCCLTIWLLTSNISNTVDIFGTALGLYPVSSNNVPFQRDNRLQGVICYPLKERVGRLSEPSRGLTDWNDVVDFAGV
jgi:hypothetical protein